MVDVNAPDDDRTTVQGLFVYADAYLASARCLQREGLPYGHSESPIRFMLYHAAELYLKAFLRASGITVARLRALGHKFSRLLPACTERGLALPDASVAALLAGEGGEDVIETRYIRTGFRQQRPTAAALAEAAISIRRAIREHPARQGHIVLRGEGNGEFGAELEAAWDAS